MPIDLKNLVTGEKRLPLSYQGHSFEVVYKVGWFTPEASQSYNKRVEEADNDTAFLERFLAVVVDWDVMDGKTKLPLTAEGLGRLTWALLIYIWAQISEDRRMGEAASGSLLAQ